jgi:rubrerythrin
MGDIQENLRAAFAGESQASRRYTAFAQRAEKEGYPNVARLFRAAAQAETVHAIRDLNALGENRTTEANLAAAIEGETYEVDVMYPGFLEDVDPEEQTAPFKAFDFARRVEMLHAEYYREALATVKAGRDLPAREVFVCRHCGYTCYDEAPDKCPVCGAPKEDIENIP